MSKEVLLSLHGFWNEVEQVSEGNWKVKILKPDRHDSDLAEISRSTRSAALSAARATVREAVKEDLREKAQP